MRRKFVAATITAAGITIGIAVTLAIVVTVIIATYPRPTDAQEPCAVPPTEEFNVRIVNRNEPAGGTLR